MKKIPVIITTEYRGVFFGMIDPATKKDRVLEVSECRNVIYWESKVEGFLGLSATGPTSGCKIGKKAGGDVTLHNITSATTCSDEATAKWNTYA